MQNISLSSIFKYVILKRKFKKSKLLYRLMWFTGIGIMLLAISFVFFLNHASFGKLPEGERLERIKKSPNYKDGQFRNLLETPVSTSDRSELSSWIDHIFNPNKQLKPKKPIPSIKTDLFELEPEEDILVWFGHSSYFLQLNKIKILVDPVFHAASPLFFINKPFKGSEVYSAADIPEIDYLIITHDHWDHLDYKTVLALRKRIKYVVCGLGVGAHFEYWGYDKDRIIELDWHESTNNNQIIIHCLPARHFSGRGLKENKSLWASFLIEMPIQKIYIGGDSGYDTHYENIGKKFGSIDLAILENGQYNSDWKYVHIMPEQLPLATKQLNAKRLFTVHHSKFALADHAWNEPLIRISEKAAHDSIHLLHPMIGEIVRLNYSAQRYEKWW